MSFINIQNVSKSYGKNKVLKNVDLEVNKGECLVIKGASGSGKSTLLYLIGGLEKLDQGKILVGGRDITKMNDQDLAKFRNNEVGFIFQFHFLLSSLSCLENILLPARIGGHDIAKVQKYILSLSERLGVSECLSKFPYEISGGQQQRINFIRALSLKPSLLLCDEPTGNLDSQNSNLATNILSKLTQDEGITLVLVTHDDTVASRFGNISLMKDGQLHQMPH